MTAHKHAQDMARYAQDAQETACPWVRWETRNIGEGSEWGECTTHPGWSPYWEYRRKSDVVDRFCAVVRMPARTIYVYEGKISEQAARDAVKYHQGETLLCIVKLSVDNRTMDSATVAREMVKLDFVG